MQTQRRYVRALVPALLAVVLLALPAGRASALEGLRHPKLVKSSPAANDTVRNSPTAITLWFTERVELAVARIRLMDAKGAAVALGTVMPVADRGDGRGITAAVTHPLSAGSYTVQWSAMASDGHALKASFAFVVAK
jgi:hypothetical protein